MLFTADSSMIAKYDSELSYKVFMAFSFQGTATLVASASLGFIGWKGVQVNATILNTYNSLQVFNRLFFISK